MRTPVTTTLWLLFLLLTWIGAAAGHAQQVAGEEFPRIEKIAEGVWAALQPAEGRFNDSNSVVIERGDAVLLVDTQADSEATARLLDWIDETLHKPVRWLLNTHWHVDHVGGNAAVAARYPAATLLGHTSLARDVPERGEGLLRSDADQLAAAIADARDKLARGEDLEGGSLDAEGRVDLEARIGRAVEREQTLRTTRLRAPDFLYSERLVLSVAEAKPRVEIFSLAAHTDGDSIVFLPELGILITGDVVDALPFGGHGHPGAWLASLDQLSGLAPKVLVPGHGPIYRSSGPSGAISPVEQIDRVRRLFGGVVAAVDETRARGGSLEQLQSGLLERPTLVELRRLMSFDAAGERAFDRFVPETVERAWQEAEAVSSTPSRVP
jgi:glyoxylase-like metal-dependent hydrolase (beta-lactamase superfamily II)